jgi:rsbT co-antagonist protein RsbR
MFQVIRDWSRNLPFGDPLDYRQARMLQGLLVALLGVIALDLVIIQIVTASAIERAILTTLAFPVEICLAIALVVLRRGRLRAAAILAVTTLFAVIAVAVVMMGLRTSAILVLPVGLAGVLFGRRGLWLTTGLALAVALVAGLLSYAWGPIVSVPPASQISDALVMIELILVLMALFLDGFGSGFRDVLAIMRAREGELDVLRRSLEETVAARTAALQAALMDVQTRAADQARLLTENEQQRVIIRQLSVPVIPISTSTLIMPLVGDLDSDRLDLLQGQALQAIEQSAARTLILDITGVALVDSQVAQGILGVVEATRLLGAETVLVGIRPEVAQALVGLGLNFPGLRTSSTLQAVLSEHLPTLDSLAAAPRC